MCLHDCWWPQTKCPQGSLLDMLWINGQMFYLCAGWTYQYADIYTKIQHVKDIMSHHELCLLKTVFYKSMKRNNVRPACGIFVFKILEHCIIMILFQCAWKHYEWYDLVPFNSMLVTGAGFSLIHFVSFYIHSFIDHILNENIAYTRTFVEMCSVALIYLCRISIKKIRMENTFAALLKTLAH